MKNTLALSAAAIALLVTSLPAQAAFVVDLTQVADPSQPLGFDVVATGSGTLDLTDLRLDHTPHGDNGAIQPSVGFISTGPPPLTIGSLYTRGITGPTSFGSGVLLTIASSGSGDEVGIDGPFFLSVPLGYSSGAALSDTSTYDNATFASLGVTPGTYKWTWGTGAHADSFTLDAAIPEPSTWAMMALGFAGLGLAGYRSWRQGVSIAA
jgi:hypothetical protein